MQVVYQELVQPNIKEWKVNVKYLSTVISENILVSLPWKDLVYLIFGLNLPTPLEIPVKLHTFL